MVSKPNPITSTEADTNLCSSNNPIPISRPPSHHLSPSPQNRLINSSSAQTQTKLHLPIRLPPYPPQLAALDAEFKRKYHEILNDRKHLMPRSLVFEKAEDSDDRSIGPDRQRKREMLDKNFADRTPYVQLACRRLQAVLGTRNEHVFDLPSVSSGNKTAKLNLENLYDIPDGSIWGRRIGGGGISKSKQGSKSMGSCVDLGDAEGKSDKGKRPEKRTSAHLEHHHSAMPNVDKVTGAGLREFLLSKGRERGERQRRCTSITICDFTPEMRTHGYADKVLGHWEGAAEKGQRVEVHEVELPRTSVNILTGEEATDSETWIWFLISRPVLSLSSEKSSRPLDTSTSVMSSGWRKPSFKRDSSSFNQAGDSPQPPPNFPHPIPTSWIVFACPKAHVTCYPETTETIEDRDSSFHSAFPNTSNTLQIQPQNQKVCRRSDYDLSHFGIPIFEFSSPHLFDGNCIEFSSVNGIEGWDEKDAYFPYSKDRYELEREHAELSSKREQNEYGEDQGIDPPCPNHGDWWHKFYKEMYEDARRWKKIKHAMGRGKCRVSVHWDESESKNDTAKATGTEDEGIKDADRLLRDIGLGISGAVAHARKKSRSSLGKEKITVGKHRATRSETRRRSSLGLEVWLASGSEGPSEGFEHAAAKGQKKERLRGNRKSAPVVRSGLL